MAILETQSLTKSFGALTAVSDVSLSIEAGTLHSIIGPNGAGKTTLFNLLTGTYAPTSGRIVLDGVCGPVLHGHVADLLLIPARADDTVGLYVVNVGPGLTGGSRYGIAWFHGVRLVAEPLALLIVGLSVENPKRTLRWGLAALIATVYAESLIGLLEQQLGAVRLVDYGFEYGKQVRTIGGHLRSFGSFDESFDYSPSPVPPQGRWRIHGLGLPDDVLRRVYNENARRVLGLADGAPSPGVAR